MNVEKIHTLSDLFFHCYGIEQVTELNKELVVSENMLKPFGFRTSKNEKTLYNNVMKFVGWVCLNWHSKVKVRISSVDKTGNSKSYIAFTMADNEGESQYYAVNFTYCWGELGPSRYF